MSQSSPFVHWPVIDCHQSWRSPRAAEGQNQIKLSTNGFLELQTARAFYRLACAKNYKKQNHPFFAVALARVYSTVWMSPDDRVAALWIHEHKTTKKKAMRLWIDGTGNRYSIVLFFGGIWIERAQSSRIQGLLTPKSWLRSTIFLTDADSMKQFEARHVQFLRLQKLARATLLTRQSCFEHRLPFERWGIILLTLRCGWGARGRSSFGLFEWIVVGI